MTDNHPNESPDQTKNCEAYFVFGYLGETLSVSEDDKTDVEKDLEGLQDVDSVSCYSAVDAEANVAKCLQRVSVRIQLQK